VVLVGDMEASIPSTPKLFADTRTLQRLLATVIEGANTGGEGPIEIEEARLLAGGGYDWVWLVSCVTKNPFLSNSTEALPSSKFVLREPSEDALLPHQIENEVAFLTYIGKNHPSILVPRIYAYETRSDTPFIAMEYIEGTSLNEVWMTYTESEKVEMAKDVAAIIVDLAEITFNGIGGLTLSHTLGPTVEGIKLFRGRDRFHSAECYDIGPYASTRAYICACYEKEIYYYSHASEDEVGGLFESTTKEAFIASLKFMRNVLTKSASTGLPEEPFVLNHGDCHGRNIMVREQKIVAVLDWKFAGSYPLSEVLAGTGVDVVEMVDDEMVDEAWKWSDRIVALAEEQARARGWEEEKVGLLVGQGNRELQAARMEMLPEEYSEERSEGASDNGLEAVLIDYLDHGQANVVGDEEKMAW
jgi:aminoglycoside phosphotransferase (APT) family kinase protein